MTFMIMNVDCSNSVVARRCRIEKVDHEKSRHRRNCTCAAPPPRVRVVGSMGGAAHAQQRRCLLFSRSTYFSRHRLAVWKVAGSIPGRPNTQVVCCYYGSAVKQTITVSRTCLGSPSLSSSQGRQIGTWLQLLSPAVAREKSCSLV